MHSIFGIDAFRIDDIVDRIDILLVFQYHLMYRENSCILLAHLLRGSLV